MVEPLEMRKMNFLEWEKGRAPRMRKQLLLPPIASSNHIFPKKNISYPNLAGLQKMVPLFINISKIYY